MKNYDCDGSGPCTPGTVKIMASGSCSNLILCHACFNRELQWRAQRNIELQTSHSTGLANVNPYQFDVTAWEDARVYE